MSDLCGSSPYVKGEPTATDAARLRRTLTDQQKADLRETLGAGLSDRSAAVLNPPTEHETSR